MTTIIVLLGILVALNATCVVALVSIYLKANKENRFLGSKEYKTKTGVSLYCIGRKEQNGA